MKPCLVCWRPVFPAPKHHKYCDECKVLVARSASRRWCKRNPGSRIWYNHTKALRALAERIIPKRRFSS